MLALIIQLYVALNTKKAIDEETGLERIRREGLNETRAEEARCCALALIRTKGGIKAEAEVINLLNEKG